MIYHLTVKISIDFDEFNEATEMAKTLIDRCPYNTEVLIEISREADDD